MSPEDSSKGHSREWWHACISPEDVSKGLELGRLCSIGCLGLLAEGGQGATRGLQAAPARLPNSAARLSDSVRESVRAQFRCCPGTAVGGWPERQQNIEVGSFVLAPLTQNPNKSLISYI